MKTGKPPLRMCVACRSMRPKAELLRIVLAENEEPVYDGTGRRNGRGAYLCRDKVCLEEAVKKKRFVKALGRDIPDALRRELEGLTGA